MKKKKTEMTCESCINCVPIGEGDHLCTEKNEIVIEDYAPSDLYMICKGKNFEEE